MNTKAEPAPFETPKKVDILDGLSTPLKINYLVAMASNLSPISNLATEDVKETSIQELRAIGALVRLGPQTASQLARVSRQDAANVSRTITKLVKKQLVVRIPNPEHKRSPYIWVTNGGLEYYNKLKPHLENRADQYTADFSNQEKEQLISLLKRYIKNAQ